MFYITFLFKVEDLAQLVTALVAYWLDALPKVAGSYPGGSINKLLSCTMVVDIT